MATILPSNLSPAVVLDASSMISLVAKEALTMSKVQAEITGYSQQGYLFFAPGLIVGEVLYVLCKKLNNGSLSAGDHAQAVQDFALLMSNVLPPPQGDASLILRA